MLCFGCVVLGGIMPGPPAVSVAWLEDNIPRPPNPGHSVDSTKLRLFSTCGGDAVAIVLVLVFLPPLIFCNLL